MLGVSGPRRLCQSCRYDLLRLFEYGIAGTRSRSNPVRLTLPSRPNGSRPFSQARFRAPASQKDPSPNILDEDAHKSDKHTVANDNPTPVQAEAWRLTQVLKAAVKNEPATVNETLEALYHQCFEVEPIPEFDDWNQRRKYVKLLRNCRVSREEIVRHARQKFGEAMPESVLNKEEYALYTRLYGEPREEEIPEAQPRADKDQVVGQDDQLLGENGDAVDVHADAESVDANENASNGGPVLDRGDRVDEDRTTAREPLETMDAGIREIAESLGGEVYMSEDEIEEVDEGSEDADEREHPLTRFGKFATSPRTVFPPQDTFVKPVENILASYSNKHLKEMCEKTFGGPGLPDSPSTPQSSASRQRQQLPIRLEASQPVMGEMEANAYLTAVMPQIFATTLSVLTETRKRLGASWLRNLIMKDGGPRILDAGAGGAGILAWNEIVKAEWASLHGSEAALASPAPPSKAVVLVGSDALRHRASTLLENTTFVPRLPDYVHTRGSPTLDDSRPAQQRKQFDVIIAPHTLFPVKEEYLRKQHVQNLWSLLSTSGGVLVLLEKGIPRGFEAIAGARELLLERYIASPGSESYESPLSNSLAQEDQITPKDKGMIIAPCTNHTKCPMYTVPGVASGRKDFCAFQQRFIRPKFLQRVMDGSHFNDEDVKFSYLSVMKGEDLRERKVGSWEQLVDPTTAPHRTGSDLPLDASEKAERSEDGFEVGSDPATEEQNSAHLDAISQALETPATNLLPRLIFPAIKRKGHVTMDVCTTAGRIERWTVPRSFSAQAYHDGRKTRWGDLWGLGAKTIVPRNLRLGTSDTKEGRKMERKKRRVAELDELRRERSEEEALDELDVAADGETGRRGGAAGEDVEGDDFDDLLADPRFPPPSPAQREVLERQLPSRVPDDDELDATKRLLVTLSKAESDAEIDAELREWEAEFAADRKAAHGRDRDGRRRIRGQRDGRTEAERYAGGGAKAGKNVRAKGGKEYGMDSRGG